MAMRLLFLVVGFFIFISIFLIAFKLTPDFGNSKRTFDYPVVDSYVIRSQGESRTVICQGGCDIRVHGIYNTLKIVSSDTPIIINVTGDGNTIIVPIDTNYTVSESGTGHKILHA